MRRAPLLGLLVALTSHGCAESDLLERVQAAGVYAPERSQTIQQATLDLGQVLFFDAELSGTRGVACASCHLPGHHAGDQLPRGRGVGATGFGVERTGGVVLSRNTPSPFNRSFAQTLLWDGRVERLPDGSIRAPVPLPEGIETLLEAQALLPMLDRAEMRGEAGSQDIFGATNELGALPDDADVAVWDALMDRLLAIEEYRERFHASFPEVARGEHTIVHLARAITVFEMRLWELTDTPFDRFIGSLHRTPNPHAIHGDALAGAELFFGDAGCDRCHNGPLLSDDAFHNIGVPPVESATGEVDEGRGRVTGRAADRFAFRTPPLRNVALTAPYLHDGSAPTLEAAIAQHEAPSAALASMTNRALATDASLTLSEEVAPLRALSDADRHRLVAFLQALSSDVEQFFLPEGAGEPAALPSGLPVPRAEH